jgi:hypothetical protein
MWRQPSIVSAIIVSMALILSAAAVCIHLQSIDNHITELRDAIGNPATVRVQGPGGGNWPAH